MCQTNILEKKSEMLDYIHSAIEVLEYEAEIYNSVEFKPSEQQASKTEARPDPSKDPNEQSMMLKYVQLEMIHVANNPVHDPYTSVKYPHRFFNMKFENEAYEKTPVFNSGHVVDREATLIK